MDRKPLGIMLALASYGMYSLHYATIKWIGGAYPLWQLIFVRSVITLLIALAVRGGGILLAASRSPYRTSTALRGLIQVLSMWCFYTAANSMSLAEVTTLYSAAPLIAVLLSIVVLGERVRGHRWLAVALGFAGTVIAANPGSTTSLGPTLIALASGACWALAVVLTRKSGARESSSIQLVTNVIVFIVISASLMTWKTPTGLIDCAVMLALGVQIYLAQFLFFEACRFAPASIVGPIEYSSLVWACLLGFLIFADIPTPHVIIGALLVAVGGIALILGVQGEGTMTDREVRTSGPPTLGAGSAKRPDRNL